MAFDLIQIDGFPETSALLNWLVTAGSDGEGKKISIDNVKAELGVDALMQFGGAIVPASTPDSTGDFFWVATEEGTYTNFGGVVVPASSLAVISRVDGIFTSSITTIPQPENKIETWVAGTYSQGEQRIHNGQMWSVNISSTTEEPGTGADWVDALPEKVNRSDIFDIDSLSNLIQGYVTGKTWDWTNSNNGTTGNSAVASSVQNLIGVDSGDTVYFYNLNGSTLGLASFFRVYNKDTGDYILTVPASSLTQESDTIWSYNFGADYNLGVMVHDSNIGTFAINKTGEDAASKIKPSLLPDEVALTSQSAYRNELFDVVEYSQGDEILPEWLGGYYRSDSMRLSDDLSAPGVNDARSSEPILLTDSSTFIIDGFANPPASSWGKIVDRNGVFLKNLIADDFQSLGADRYGLVAGLKEAFSVIITTLAADRPSIKIYRAEEILQIKESLISGGGVDSTDIVSEMMARGADKDKYKADGSYGIYLAGQSNSDGRAPIGELPAGLPSTLNNVQMFNRFSKVFENPTLGVNAGNQSQGSTDWSYEWGVLKRLADYKAQDIYAVKRAVGGTPLAADLSISTSAGTFHPKFEDIVPQSAATRTQDFEKRILDAFDYADANSLDINYKCMLWCQGEADSNYPEWENQYYRNLKMFIAYVRGVVGNPTLPVIILTVHKDSAQYSQKVRDAQLKLGGRMFQWDGSAVEEVEHNGEDKFVWVYNSDPRPWTTIGDDLHYNGAFNELVAADVFEIIKDL